ncbi:glycosyltransferase family 4 protein [Acidithiobacillus albertensis]|uniref:glycosyltransferase family 4 protein n=1 Tax=Acidithiobacillus albertensis TaxID=119978 RepID=UPI000ADEEF7B|nr:glycosyltransferase family 4 protein [Acidithiobacillus albertensis]
MAENTLSSDVCGSVEKMRILHITNHVLEIGNGIVNVAVDLACSQSALGHEVFYASSGGEYEKLLDRHGVKHYSMNFSKSMFGLPKMLVNLEQIIQQTRPDIVHTHMMTGALLAKLLQLRRRYRLITHVHNEFQKSARFMSVGDAVIAVSDAVCRSMVGRGISARKLHVVRNGTINSPRMQGVEAKPLVHPAIVTVAGMYERKGIRDLIAAFANLPVDLPGYLYIVGEGPDRAVFEEAARNSSRRDCIFFEGFQSQPQSYLKSADIFVLASRKDPFPLVILEARENACAIIASDVDGIPEALEGGKAGQLFIAGDVTALSHQLHRFLCAPDLREQFAERACTGIEWLTVQRMTQETLDLYQRVLQP